jgi:hypothetical protein
MSLLERDGDLIFGPWHHARSFGSAVSSGSAAATWSAAWSRPVRLEAVTVGGDPLADHTEDAARYYPCTARAPHNEVERRGFLAMLDLMLMDPIAGQVETRSGWLRSRPARPAATRCSLGFPLWTASSSDAQGSRSTRAPAALILGMLRYDRTPQVFHQLGSVC